MLDMQSVTEGFDALHKRFPGVGVHLIAQARDALGSWAMQKPAANSKLLVSRLDSAAKGEIFNGSPERLASTTISGGGAEQYKFFVAYMDCRDGLCPPLAHLLATEVRTSARAHAVEFDMDRWRLMAMPQIAQMAGDLYAPLVARILADDSAEANLAYALQHGEQPPYDLRALCTLRLETVSLTDVTWAVCERLSGGEVHSFDTPTMALRIDSSIKRRRQIQEPAWGGGVTGFAAQARAMQQALSNPAVQRSAQALGQSMHQQLEQLVQQRAAHVGGTLVEAQVMQQAGILLSQGPQLPNNDFAMPQASAPTMVELEKAELEKAELEKAANACGSLRSRLTLLVKKLKL